MKKHIFGVALFSLIVASFAIIYAFFYTPSIPPKEAVKPPVSQTAIRPDKPTSCYPKRSKGVNYVIESASYFEEEKKLVAKIKLYWNGSGEAPRKISIRPRIFQADNNEIRLPAKDQTLANPFEHGDSVSLNYESEFVLDAVRSNPVNLFNLYLAFDLLAADGSSLTSEKPNLAEAFHILYVYGKSSVMRLKTRSVPGSTVPR